jgi:hypothetical protein
MATFAKQIDFLSQKKNFFAQCKEEEEGERKGSWNSGGRIQKSSYDDLTIILKTGGPLITKWNLKALQSGLCWDTPILEIIVRSFVNDSPGFRNVNIWRTQKIGKK